MTEEILKNVNHIENFNQKSPYFLATIFETHIPLLYIVYELLKYNHNIELKEVIAEKLSINADTVDRILQFLSSVGILGQSDDYYYVINLIDALKDKNIHVNKHYIYNLINSVYFPELFYNDINETIIEENEFKLLLLLKFSEIKKRGIWNKQAYFFLLYQELLTNAYNYIIQPDKKASDFENYDKYFILTKEYIPLHKDKKARLEFNQTKFKILFELYNYLGLVEKEQIRNRFVLSVDKNLLLLIIKLIFLREEKEKVSLKDFFKDLKDFLPFEFENKIISEAKVVPFPYAYSLYILQKENKIALGYRDDEGRIVLNLREILDGTRYNGFIHSNIELLDYTK